MTMVMVVVTVKMMMQSRTERVASRAPKHELQNNSPDSEASPARVIVLSGPSAEQTANGLRRVVREILDGGRDRRHATVQHSRESRKKHGGAWANTQQRQNNGLQDKIDHEGTTGGILVLLYKKRR